MGKLIDLTGQRFGRLVVLARAENKGSKVQWLCKCDCGKLTITLGDSLRFGRTQSCGCRQREVARVLKTKYPNKNSRLYSIWCDMKARCYVITNPNYIHYGGRGIYICEEWREDYKAFESWSLEHGYKDDFTIDRINNDGPYSTQNCHWVGRLIQANNKRNNILLEFSGKRKTIAQWARDTGIPYDTLNNRIHLGWTDEEVLTTPVRKRK